MVRVLNEAADAALTVFEAGRRVAAMALVDTALAVPLAKPLCDTALSALSLKTSTGKEFMYYRPSQSPSVLLLLCHPSRGPSMCRALAEVWEQSLQALGLEVCRVELGSRAAFAQLGLSSEQDLVASKQGSSAAEPNEEVRQLQDLVEKCRYLVFVHPVFWFDVPSQLKGFQESVLSSGFAFRKLPGNWLLNRAVDVVERVPGVRLLARRYASYGLLRDKQVFITRTQGGPAAGMGIFGHEATSLESSVQFCGAHLVAVDIVGELDDLSNEDLTNRVLPKTRRQIQEHCRRIAASAKRVPVEDSACEVPKMHSDASGLSARSNESTRMKLRGDRDWIGATRT